MNTWLVHVFITPLVRIPVEVRAVSREQAAEFAIDAAVVLGAPHYEIEVKRIIE